jgi:hypothetical protein
MTNLAIHAMQNAAPSASRGLKDRIIYWTTTGVVASVMIWSAYNFSLNEEMKGAFLRLGLPNWFRIELTVAKAVGTLALLIPAVPRRIKDFAYAGFAITMVSACIAHAASGDGWRALDPLVFLTLLVVSYWYSFRVVLTSQRAPARSRSSS